MLDIEKNELSEISMEDALPLFSENCKRNLLEHDTDAERQFREQGRRRDIYFISCQGLAKNEEFTKMMKDSLAVLEEAYGTPVDIEYTVNLGKEKTVGGESNRKNQSVLQESEEKYCTDSSGMYRNFFTGIGSSRGICGYQRILCYFGKTG